MATRRIIELRGDSRSIREHAYISIQHKIATRELPAGTPVSDVKIANELGSSRTPVREALRQLLSEGFLEQSPGGTLLVVRLTGQDISDLFEMREALEIHAVRKVARTGLPAADELQSREQLDKMLGIQNELKSSGESALGQERMWRFETVDVGFHTVLMRASENSRSHRTVNELRRLINIFTMRRRGHELGELEVLNRQHNDLLAAVVARDPDRAVSLLSNHIQTSQRVRLEQFAQWERELSLEESVPAYLSGVAG